jgi:hypothetical protein
VGVLDDAVEVKAQGAQGGVVGVGEAVDYGMEGVAADDVVFLFYKGVLVVAYGLAGVVGW